MDVKPYRYSPLDTGEVELTPGFREASAGEIRRWNVDAHTLRGLFEAAKASDEGYLVMDDVFGGTAWRRNQEGHGGLVVHADVLEEALRPSGL